MQVKKRQILDEGGHLRNTTIKDIEVDFSSLEDLHLLQDLIKSQISNLKCGNGDFISRAQANKIAFNACCNILETDISQIYSSMDLDQTKKYYVYAHCDPSHKIAVKKDGKSTFAATLGMKYFPFYIGKGTGNRAFELNRNETHKKIRQKIKTFGQDIDVVLLKTDLSEVEALMLESKLIDVFGLISFSGKLVNLDEGINNKERRNCYAEHLRELNNFYRNSV